MKIRFAAATGAAGVLLLMTGCTSITAGQAAPAAGAAAAVAASTSSSDSDPSSTGADSGDGSDTAVAPTTDSDSDSDSTDDPGSSVGTDGNDSDGNDLSTTSSSTGVGDDDPTTGDDATVPNGSGMASSCLSVAGAALDVTQGKAGLTKLKADVAKAGTLPANLAKDFALLEQTLSSASDSDDIYAILAGNTEALNAYTDISNWMTKNC